MCLISVFFLIDDSEYSVSIPNYILRGAGKKTHYEYEVRLNLVGEKWTVLRRYSRFRELHLSMRNCYGDPVKLQSNIAFLQLCCHVFCMSV